MKFEPKRFLLFVKNKLSLLNNFIYENIKIKKPCGFLLHTKVWSLFWFLDTENFLSRVVFCAEKIRGEIFSCSQKNTHVTKPQHRKILPIRFGIFGIEKLFCRRCFSNKYRGFFLKLKKICSTNKIFREH